MKTVLLCFFLLTATVFLLTATLAFFGVVKARKDKGKTDDEAMKEAMHVVNSRKDKWLPGSWAKDKRWGAHSKEEWEAQVKFAGLEAQVKDVSPFFTNELLDEVNKFDAAAIVKMAKEFKI